MPLLKEIETLARLYRDGALTEAEYNAAKTAILEEVPEAKTAPEDTRMQSETLLLLGRCLLPPLGIGSLAVVFGIPAMLSLTLGVTVLAALVVAEVRRWDT